VKIKAMPTPALDQRPATNLVAERTNTRMSTNAEIVKHHVESLVSGDVDEVMSDFSANAVILCGQQPIRGSEAMRAFFSDASASLDGFELDVSVGERDHHYIAWHTADGLRGTDTFHIRDGRIVLQTAFFMDQ
jgi:limonene-1,2-epoxide hydrolase